ncbi:MAG: 4Fe-4S binding protein [Promethearchaeota archaeon]
MKKTQKQPKKPTEKSKRYKRLYGPVATIFSFSNTGSLRLVKPLVDFSRCTKCRICEKYCPSNVIEIKPNSERCVEIDWFFCKGCGICANVCRIGCIEMVEEKNNE